MERQYSAPAADGALAVLEFLVDHPGEWGPTEITRRVGIGVNLTFRILNTLARRGYVVRLADGRCRLSSKLFSLGMKLHAGHDLRLAARPMLETLARVSGEACHLQVPDGDAMVLWDSVAPARDFYLNVTPGTRLCYHGNAFGKIAMAFMPEAEREQILSADLKKLTPRTETDPERLREEILRAARDYYAVEDGEYVSGCYCIAAPVFDAAGRLAAAAGIAGLREREQSLDFQERIELVKDCARRITRLLGGEFYPGEGVPEP